MYIDTSCLAAYYLPEPGSNAVQEVMQKHDQVVISYLTEVELRYAINKKQRIGDLSKDDGNRTWRLFKNHRRTGLYEVAEMGPGVFKSAEWMLEHSTNALRALDAIHLGVAHHYGFDLYTFDQTLLEAAEEFNINTFSG